MEKKNFKAFTNLNPFKKNAIQLCGQEFVDSLTANGIYAKDDKFWIEVNRKLNIPDNAYDQRKIREKVEREQALAEEIAREKAEMERLLSNKKKFDSKNRNDWTIVVFELLETDEHGNKFVAECTKSSGAKLTTQLFETSQEAYSRACNLVDENEKQSQKYRRFIEHYQVLKPLYLMLIYLSGGDEHYDYLKSRPKKRGIENFIGVSFYNGFDYDIIAQLEKEGLLERSTTGDSLILFKKGMQVARDMLKTINIDGVERLLEQRNYHEDYINYKSQSEEE
ncbi:MAG: hypothetical protein RIE73_37325 [Coleofasciculus sp. C1-SOL-03]|uniref:hypothetical protein n=1 Tax=Coleofasciculus sp. C1-SOL-03 TaxID=3069522 RepID=UPI0032F547C9